MELQKRKDQVNFNKIHDEIHRVEVFAQFGGQAPDMMKKAALLFQGISARCENHDDVKIKETMGLKVIETKLGHLDNIEESEPDAVHSEIKSEMITIVDKSNESSHQEIQSPSGIELPPMSEISI